MRTAVDPNTIQKNLKRSLHRTLLTNDLKVAARCVVLQTAVDTFCTRCQHGEDGIRAISRRIKACAATECPLHPVRPSTSGTKTTSTLANLQIEAKNYGKPKRVGWTQEEELDLLDRHRRKHTIKRIALDTNRTVNDISDRLDLVRRAANRNKVLLNGSTE